MLLNIKRLFVLEARLLLSLQASLCSALRTPPGIVCLRAAVHIWISVLRLLLTRRQVYRPPCLLEPSVNIFPSSCEADAGGATAN